MGIESEEKEKSYIQNQVTKMFLKGFQHNKPLWTIDKDNAAEYEDLDALAIQRRLETMYAPYQKITIVEKKIIT